MKRHHFLLGATLSESVTLGRVVAAVLFVMLFVTGCKNDDDDTPAERITIEKVNVDVILPDARRTLWQPVIDLALQNIELAQQGLSKRVELNMRYHDEDAEDLGLTVYSLCYPEEGDDTCDVILGPTRSTKCQMVLGNAAQYRVPVLMPTATSDEIQRIQAERPYSWFFTESDVTSCVVVSLLVIAAFVFLYNKLFAVTFDEDFATATGTKANLYNLIIAIIIAVIIVISMNFVGSLLVSALIIFPALSAMRVLKNFKAVTVCAACLSVFCASLGFFASLLLETPLGATMVAVNILAFGLFTVIGAVKSARG